MAARSLVIRDRAEKLVSLSHTARGELRLSCPGFGAPGPESRLVPLLIRRTVTDLEGKQLRRLSASARRTCGDQPRDPRERAQIVEIDVVDPDFETETPLELYQQLHQLKRVENAGLEKIGVRGRHLDVETVDK